MQVFNARGVSAAIPRSVVRFDQPERATTDVGAEMTHAAAPGTNDRENAAVRPVRRWALVALSLSVLMSSLDTSIANVALPAMAQALGASFRQVQWIVLAYLLVVTSLIVSAGDLGDRLGRKRLLLSGIALFTAASLACGLAPTLNTLVAARALQGVGGAFMLALTLAFVGETVDESRRGTAMGVLGTMSAVGTTLGPSLGGVLLARYGWPMIFLVNLPLGAVNLWLAAVSLPADASLARTPRRSFDLLGTILLVATLSAYALSMTIGGSVARGSLALLALAAVGAFGFTRRMLRARSPLVSLALLRDERVRVGLSSSVLVSTVMMATLVVGPFFLHRALQLDASRVGLVMSVGPLVSALAGVPAGRLVDRFGTARTTKVALSTLTLGLTVFAIAPQHFGVIGYLVSISLVTASYAQFQAANNTSVTQAARPEQRGVIAGMLGLSRNVGLISGASVMGAVFALASASTDVASASPSAVAAGMCSTFLLGALLVAGAFTLASGWPARLLARPSLVRPSHLDVPITPLRSESDHA